MVCRWLSANEEFNDESEIAEIEQKDDVEGIHPKVEKPEMKCLELFKCFASSLTPPRIMKLEGEMEKQMWWFS